MITEELKEGRECARTLWELKEELLRTPAYLREQIRQERLAGVPICEAGGGYYLPRDRGELYEYAERKGESILQDLEEWEALQKPLNKPWPKRKRRIKTPAHINRQRIRDRVKELEEAEEYAQVLEYVQGMTDEEIKGVMREVEEKQERLARLQYMLVEAWADN